jgi:hypothetical protein
LKNKGKKKIKLVRGRLLKGKFIYWGKGQQDTKTRIGNMKKMQKRKKSISGCLYGLANVKNCIQFGRRRSDGLRMA